MSSDAAVGSGGVAREPKLKKWRTERGGEDGFKHDGPVENEETAREKMKEAGFDPDDVTKQCRLSDSAVNSSKLDTELDPMAYFCRIGDLKMCRYLLSKGASTTATSTCRFWFPMYTAALGGQLDVCKWLYDHGADKHISRRNASNYSPLQVALSELSMDRKNTGRWFILKGVLSLDDKPGFVCPRLMRRDIQPERIEGVTYDERRQILEWAKQAVQTHSGFMTFIMGTLPEPVFTQFALQSLLAERLQSQDAAEMMMEITPRNQYECLWRKIIKRTTPVRYFGGKIGVLELIADYAGVVRGRDLRILRTLVDPLSKYLEEVPEGRLDPEGNQAEEVETDEEEDEE